jgi:hypothetical protein
MAVAEPNNYESSTSTAQLTTKTLPRIPPAERTKKIKTGRERKQNSLLSSD